MVEPEWDDRARDDAEALGLHDRQVCPGCGLHPAFLADPERHLALEDVFCEMCLIQARHERRLAARSQEFEKAHQNADPGTRRPTDGLHTHIKALTPAEVADRKTRRTTDG